LLVPRPRLLARLEAGVPLTVVRAPLGFGKTTVLGQWLATRTAAAEEITAWLRLSADLAAAEPFWTATFEAVRAAAAPGPLRTDRTDGSARIRVRRLLATSQRPVTLVLDGFDHVTADDVEPDLLALLHDLSTFNLVVALRGQRRFRAANLVDLDHIVLSAEHLAFTAGETGSLIQLSGMIAAAAIARQLHDRTGGWPEPSRALALALGAAGSPMDERSFEDLLLEVGTEFVRERLLPYFGGPEQLAVALRTSLLDPIPPELAEVLCGPTDDTITRLAELEAGGLLTAEVRDGRRRLRWPGAIRAALYAEAVRRAPDRVRADHCVAARWYLDEAQGSPALKHALAARDWRLLVRVIEGHWGDLVTTDRDGLLAAFAAVPADVLRGSLLSRLTRSIIVNAPDGAILDDLPLLPAEPERLDALGRDATAPARLEIALAAMTILRLQGRLAQASEQASRLEIVVDSANAAHTSEVAPRVPPALLQAGVTHLHAGNLDLAQPPLQRAHHLVAPGSGSYVAGDAASKLALLMSMQGRSEHAEVWLREFGAAPRPPGWLGYRIGSTALTARTWSALDQLDLPAATELLADIHNEPVLVRQGNWSVITYIEALHGLHTGQPDRALEGLLRATSTNKSLLERGGLAHVLTGSMRAELLLALGRANQARVSLDALPDRPLVRTARARLALLGNDHHQVLALADDYQWFNTAATRASVEMLVLKAVAHHRIGQHATAAATLGNAVHAAAGNRLRRPFATVPRNELLEIAAGLPADAVGFLTHPALAEALIPYPARLDIVALTDRERHIVTLMATGQRAQQISAVLFLSYNTVRTYQRQIYRKLGATSQEQAVSTARAYGLIPPAG
jgi:LuxR family maltose regulon positive regulatory protein